MPGDQDVATTTHRSGLGAWERAVGRPSRPLRGVVQRYTGYRQRLATPAAHRGIPGASLPLVIDLGPSQTITLPGTGSPVRVGSFVAGLHDRHVTIEADEFHGIQVDLDPIAGVLLLGRPLRELTGEVVPLADVFGPAADRLVDDLATTAGWRSRFRLLDRALEARLAGGRAPRPELRWAWRRIADSAGTVRIDALATELGWSRRHLSARFAQQLGLSPKRMTRLVRFEHAAIVLAAGERSLAEVAAVAGYYDQAHLTHEVRVHAGVTPGELIARRLPDEGGVFDRHDAGQGRPGDTHAG